MYLGTCRDREPLKKGGGSASVKKENRMFSIDRAVYRVARFTVWRGLPRGAVYRVARVGAVARIAVQWCGSRAVTRIALVARMSG